MQAKSNKNKTKKRKIPKKTAKKRFEKRKKVQTLGLFFCADLRLRCTFSVSNQKKQQPYSHF